MINATRPSLALRAWRFFKFKLNNFRVIYLGRLLRTLRTPALPANPDGKVLLHIGCGEFDDPRYINIDKRKMQHIHYIGSAEDLSAMPAGSADLIYMCHILEHISHLQLGKVLCGLRERLKEGGVLRVAVPDFDKMLDIYRETGRLDYIVPPLMGGQDYPENYHAAVFNADYLTRQLTEAGFREVRPWEPGKADYHSFEDWSVLPFHVGGKEAVK